MTEKENVISIVGDGGVIEEIALFDRVASIIENRKARAGAYANCELTLMRWEIGFLIRSVLLSGERAEYGKQIVAKLSSQLAAKYGNTFDATNLYERKPNEKAPIGIILCASANRKKVEMLEMDKAGIAVAVYWTTLPPKAEFEEKIRTMLVEAQERLARRKLLSPGSQKQLDYFFEPKGDEDE
ncbi:MAG: DUF1016 domain-containing protein [Desulfovibrio sp.]|jgi:hypothetical protein|nr:DUF1016 domain-containing protein [Desulfovibrio sp.]